MSTNQLRQIALTVTCVAFALTLLPLWWWAFHDMSQRIGVAWIVTCFMVWFTAAFLWIAYSEKLADERHDRNMREINERHDAAMERIRGTH